MQGKSLLSIQNTLLTRSIPLPNFADPLRVKSESIIISNAQNSAFYTDCLVTMCLVSFIGHKVTCLLGHNVPCFFCWPQSGQCVCIVIASFIVVGHKVTHAWPMRFHCYYLIHCFGHKAAHVRFHSL